MREIYYYFISNRKCVARGAILSEKKHSWTNVGQWQIMICSKYYEELDTVVQKRYIQREVEYSR